MPHQRSLVKFFYWLERSLGQNISEYEASKKLELLRSENKDFFSKLANETPYSRFPVWENNSENIIGIMYVKDLLRGLLLKKFDIKKGTVALARTDKKNTEDFADEVMKTISN